MKTKRLQRFSSVAAKIQPMESSQDKNTSPTHSKATFVYLLKAGLFGFVLGYLLAFLLGRSVWLEMRFNTGLVIPGAAAGSMFFSLLKKIKIRYPVFLLLQIISILVFFLLYPFEISTLTIIPGCLFREGCRLTSLGLPWINMILAFLLLAGNVIWIFHEARLPRSF